MQLKSANFTFSKKRERRAAEKRDDKRKTNTRRPPPEEQPPNEEISEEDLEEIKRKGKITCFRCRGRGHMAKGCSTPVSVAENINWGGIDRDPILSGGGEGPGVSIIQKCNSQWRAVPKSRSMG